MSYLFIDSGVATMGLNIFESDRRHVKSKYISTPANWSLQDRIEKIYREIEEFIKNEFIELIVFEQYDFRDDTTGKSKKGQNTKLVNGVIAGLSLAHCIPWERMKYSEWTPIWGRIKLFSTIPVIPDEIKDNNHVYESYKMGYSFLTRKGGEKQHDKQRKFNESKRGN